MAKRRVTKGKGSKTKRKPQQNAGSKRKRSKAKGTGRRKSAGRQPARGTVTSRAALAKAIGVSAMTITRMLARDDCPLAAAGPWSSGDVGKLKIYRQMLQEDRAEALHPGGRQTADEEAGLQPGARAKVDVQLKLERIKKLRRERQVLEGEYILRDEVVAGWASRARYFKATLYSMLRSIAPRVAAQDNAAECEKLLLRAGDELLDGYTRQPLPGVDDPVA